MTLCYLGRLIRDLRVFKDAGVEGESSKVSQIWIVDKHCVKNRLKLLAIYKGVSQCLFFFLFFFFFFFWGGGGFLLFWGVVFLFSFLFFSFFFFFLGGGVAENEIDQNDTMWHAADTESQI